MTEDSPREVTDTDLGGGPPRFAACTSFALGLQEEQGRRSPGPTRAGSSEASH